MSNSNSEGDRKSWQQGRLTMSWIGSPEDSSWLSRSAMGQLREFVNVDQVNRKLESKGFVFFSAFLGDEFLELKPGSFQNQKEGEGRGSQDVRSQFIGDSWLEKKPKSTKRKKDSRSSFPNINPREIGEKSWLLDKGKSRCERVAEGSLEATPSDQMVSDLGQGGLKSADENLKGGQMRIQKKSRCRGMVSKIKTHLMTARIFKVTSQDGKMGEGKSILKGV
ncbi:hypothetical protein Q3G72_027689 [Acer saccharum]|nr:hypothetical protein Q3G72_027689 [Acer saccharum]